MTSGKTAAPFRLSFLMMIGILLVAWGMWMLVLIPRTSMHPDESWTYDYMEIADSPVEMVQILTSDTHPPMWWIIFWTWYQATGGSEFAGRWLAAFFGMLTLAFVYRLGLNWFHDVRYGLFAVLLLVFSAPFAWLSTEIRPYSLLFFLTCYSMFTFRRWMRQQTWRTAAFYAAACAMLMYIHYYLAFLIVAQAGYWLLSRPSRRLMKQGAGVLAMGFLIWSPWLPIFIRQVRLLLTVGQSEKGGIAFIPTTSVTSPENIVALLTTTASGFPWLPVVLLAAGAFFLRRSPIYRLLLTWAIVPITLVLLINLRVEVFTLRYLSYGLVGIMVTSGMGLAGLPLPRWLSWLAVSAVVALMAVNMSNYLPVHPPYREVLQSIAAEYKPDDLIYLDFVRNDERHLKRQLAMYLPAEMHQSLVTEVPDDTPAKRIWHVTDALLQPDKQAHFQRLNDGSRVVKLSIGECSARYCLVAQLLESPPLDAPIIFGENIPFYGYETNVISADQLQVILWWRFATPPGFDYSIGLYLLDAAGNTITQTDGTIHNYYGGADVAMTAAELDHHYLDVRTLTLPPGLSPDTAYTLSLAVYDWRNGERLPVNGSDALTLGTFMLPAPND